MTQYKEESLNARLRNRIQPLHTTFELIEEYNIVAKDEDYVHMNIILSKIFSEDNIQLLKDFEDFLIR